MEAIEDEWYKSEETNMNAKRLYIEIPEKEVKRIRKRQNWSYFYLDKKRIGSMYMGFHCQNQSFGWQLF